MQVFDAGRVGRGATYATAGVLAPFIEAPTPGTFHQLTLQSFHMYPDFVAAVRTASDTEIEYRRCGTFEVAAAAPAAAAAVQGHLQIFAAAASLPRPRDLHAGPGPRAYLGPLRGRRFHCDGTVQGPRGESALFFEWFGRDSATPEFHPQ